MKKALILVNVGTPDKPTIPKVGKYLFEFLNDKYVIDLPWLARKLLVNIIIIPFRVVESTKLYKRLWTDKGSPLLIYLKSLEEKLQSSLADEYKVIGAMRYGNPSIDSAIELLKKENYDEVTILPLYPQYASSTTETVKISINKCLNRLDYKPIINFIEHFYSHSAFIDAFIHNIKRYDYNSFDHLVFTYHGLPNRHIKKMHPETSMDKCNCVNEMPKFGNLCYKAACYQTTRLLVEQLNIPIDKHSVSFQSRLTKNWLSPFTDDTIINLAKTGKKRILVISPSFVADCLETIIEIEQDYKKLFIESGGEDLVMVESLNDNDVWVSAVKEIVTSKKYHPSTNHRTGVAS